MATTNLLINSNFSTTFRDTRNRRPTVADAVEVVAGWWLIVGAAGGDALPQRGFIRLTGGPGTQLVQPLPDRTRGVQLTANATVISGTLAAGVSLETSAVAKQQLTSTNGDQPAVGIFTPGWADMVVFSLAEPDTVVDISAAVLSPTAAGPAPVPSAAGARAGVSTKSTPPPARPAAVNIKPQDTKVGDPGGDGGDGGGGIGDYEPPSVSISAPKTFPASYPGAKIAVTGTWDRGSVTGKVRPSISATAWGRSFAAQVNADGTWSASVPAYVTTTVQIDAVAAFYGALHSQTVSTGAPAAVGITLANSTPSVAVETATVTPAAQGKNASVSIVVATDSTSTYGPHAVLAAVDSPDFTGATQLIATDDTHYSATLTIPAVGGTAYGAHSVSVASEPVDPATGQGMARLIFGTATSASNYWLQGTATAQVTCPDITPPAFSVTSPDPASPNAVNDLTKLRIWGVIGDLESGVDPTTVKLHTQDDPANAHKPVAVEAGPSATAPVTWSDEIDLPATAASTTSVDVFMWASDNAKDAAGKPAPNEGKATWTFTLVNEAEYAPATVEDRISGWKYLGDLLTYAAGQLQVTPPGEAKRQAEAGDVVSYLAQPMDKISTPTSLASQVAITAPMNELRVPVEVLRQHISAEGIASTAAKPDYLAAAYDALLAGLGTSYAQLRSARAASSANRAGIAQQIGLVAANDAAGRPDQLDQITLDRSRLSDETLQAWFGLPSTLRSTVPGEDGTVAVLAPVLPGQVTLWQQQNLHSTWQTLDAQAPQPDSYQVLLDPDVVATSDIPGDPAAPVTALLTSRQSDLADFTAKLAALTEATDAARLAAIVSGADLPTGFSLADLSTAQNTGTDITATLAQAGLDQAGFAYLANTYTLLNTSGLTANGAQAGILTQTEWDDVVDVLVAARRRRQYPDWRDEEVAQHLVLDPATFIPTGPGPTLGPYRAQPHARAAWQRTLALRAAQSNSLAETATSMIAGAETAALPMLRDALLDDIVTARTAAGMNTDRQSVGDELTRRYFLDMLVSGTQTTDRPTVGTASLRLFLEDARADELPPAAGNDPAWSLVDAKAFDSAWPSMDSFAAWSANTSVYLFPEAALGPYTWAAWEASPDAPGSGVASNEFRTLLAALQNGGVMTPNAIATQPPVNPGAGKPPLLAYQDAVTGWIGTGFAYYPGDLSKQSDLLAKFNAAAIKKDLAHKLIEAFWVVPTLIGTLLRDEGEYPQALQWLSMLYPYGDPPAGSIFPETNTELDLSQNGLLPGADLSKPVWEADPDDTLTNPFALLADPVNGDQVGRPAPFLRATALSIIDCLIQYGDSQYTTGTTDSLPEARQAYMDALAVTALPCLKVVAPRTAAERGYDIPQLVSLDLTARTRLTLMRQGRNIAGQLTAPVKVNTAIIQQPTAYPYKTLLTRAQALASQAGQLEQQLEAALSNLDAKKLQTLNAQQAVAVAQGQVAVQQSQVKTAQDGVAIAVAGVTKADSNASALQQLVDNPSDQYEQSLFGDYTANATLQSSIAAAGAVIGVSDAIASAASLTNFLGAPARLVEGAGYVAQAGLQTGQALLQATMQSAQLSSSIEERQRQAQIQLTSAQGDLQVARAQSAQASDQLATANDQAQLTRLQATQAQQTLQMVTDQTMSAAMYSWLVGVLGGIYRDYLQRATATAQLAQAQLGFERAEPAQTLIRSGYWTPPAALISTDTPSDTQGLTGAEQLQQDLARLDDYAFSTDARRLNVTQTISLAQLLPNDFLAFKTTGAIGFRTPAAWFDQDLPGQYLRLIRQVSVSIAALIPPNRGVRATLANPGVSQAVTRTSTGFSEVTLQRQPSSIAFTATTGATGVFAVDLQPQILLPFEGSGVDTSWTLELPRAANPFDFSTITDIVISIDYTASYSEDYRTTVVRQLNSDLLRTGDAVFSMSRDFPDQWYTICNPTPADAADDRSVDLVIPRAAFPPNVSPLQIANFATQLSQTGDVDLSAVSLTIAHASQVATAQTGREGVVSTRRGAQAVADALGGHDPTGTWTITIGADKTSLIDDGTITDILIDITWNGQAEAWT